MHKNKFHTSQRTNSVSITKAYLLMLFKKIILVYREIH